MGSCVSWLHYHQPHPEHLSEKSRHIPPCLFPGNSIFSGQRVGQFVFRSCLLQQIPQAAAGGVEGVDTAGATMHGNQEVLACHGTCDNSFFALVLHLWNLTFL